jgi:hypothetical protein
MAKPLASDTLAASVNRAELFMAVQSMDQKWGNERIWLSGLRFKVIYNQEPTQI